MTRSTFFGSTGRSICLAVGLFVAALAAAPAQQAEAREGTRTLKLYFANTKERGEFTFKRNGRYDKGEIAKINRFLRDWRRNEPANMDPQLFDLIWSIYKQTGSKDYIHVVSAYRSLKTNNMLRSRSKGVAKTSQHTAGKAMDFYIPGVPLAKLRAIAMKHQGGGVGFYPTSGSPFVHVDTGNVRSWPRMSRQQLMALFPDGQTLYLPADGKPLKGYEIAVAKRKSSGGTAVAYLDSGSDDQPERKKGTVGGWLKRVFDADEAEDNEATGTAAAPQPAPAAPAAREPAPTRQPAPAEQPEVLVAEAAPAAPPRLPRPRPGSEAGAVLATLAPVAPNPVLPAAAEPAAPVQVAVASPAETAAIDTMLLARVPRSRPDRNATAGAAAEPPPAANAADAIAALASDAGKGLPETLAEKARQTRVELAFAGGSDKPAAIPAVAGAAPASAPAPADALSAATALAGKGDAQAQAGRPVAIAFAGSGLPPFEPPANPLPTVPQAAPQPVAETEQPAVNEDEIVLASIDPQEDIGALLAAEPPVPELATPKPVSQAVMLRPVITAALNGETVTLTLPEPRGATDLFRAPDNASEIGTLGQRPKLPAGRFQTAQAARQEGGFLSNLFGGWTE